MNWFASKHVLLKISTHLHSTIPIDKYIGYKPYVHYWFGVKHIKIFEIHGFTHKINSQSIDFGWSTLKIYQLMKVYDGTNPNEISGCK